MSALTHCLTHVQEADQFTISADIPGVSKEDIKIDVDDDVLTLSVKQDKDKEEDQDTTERSYMRMERSSKFSPRSIRVPEAANADEIQAKHSNGVIVITIPKKEDIIAKKRSISIE